jgi:hypothetical protein
VFAKSKAKDLTCYYKEVNCTENSPSVWVLCSIHGRAENVIKKGKSRTTLGKSFRENG